MDDFFLFFVLWYLDCYQQVSLMRGTGRNEPRLYHRSTSAKARSERSQLQTSWVARNNAQLAQNLNLDPAKILAFEPQKNSLFGMSNQEIGRFKRHSAKNTNKSVEELFEENLQLKKENHRLGQEVMQLRGKFQAKSKNDSQRGKQLDLQFEKQLYWGGSKTHLISGIKRQYLKLQKKCQEQEQELNRLKIALMETKYPQAQVHAEVLQVQNKKLTEKMRKLSEAAMKVSMGGKKVAEAIIVELEEKINRFEKQLGLARDTQEILQQETIKKEKKVLFLEKLLIEKDNGQYHAHRRIKKLQRLTEQLKGDKSDLHEEIKTILVKHEAQKESMLKQKEIQVQCAREESKMELQELRSKMELLLEDKRELENNMAKLKMSSSAIHSNSAITRSPQRKFHVARRDSFAPQNFQLHPIIKPIQTPNDDLFNGYESELESNMSQKEKKPRVMQLANKKHSNRSKKMRKVNYSEVIDAAEFIKYKLIAANVSLDQMKNYFNCTIQFLLPQEGEWETEHISMKETMKILQSEPFKLDEEGATLLARYLIEDCNEEFVYCDEGNENKRDIVKSIMKSLIGSYSLPDETILKQVEDFKNKYLGNFYSALKTYYPNGKVGKRKFVEILLSMGTELTERSQELIVAKVVDKSANLLELQYTVLESL